MEELNRSRNDLRERGVFHDYQHSETTPEIDELRALIDSLNRQVMELSDEGPVSVWYMAYGGTGLTATTEQEYMKFDIDLPVDRVDLFLRYRSGPHAKLNIPEFRRRTDGARRTATWRSEPGGNRLSRGNEFTGRQGVDGLCARGL